MNTEQQIKLQAFLDGELPEPEARQVLAWTQRDAGAAALLAELKNTRLAMAGAGPHLTVPEPREFYWSKIEHEIRRPERQTVAAPDGSIFVLLRRFLFPAVALSALVIAGLIAHFNAPKVVVEHAAGADMPTVETTLANSDATAYRDESEGTTLVWFSNTLDENPANNAPAAIN